MGRWLIEGVCGCGVAPTSTPLVRSDGTDFLAWRLLLVPLQRPARASGFFEDSLFWSTTVSSTIPTVNQQPLLRYSGSALIGPAIAGTNYPVFRRSTGANTRSDLIRLDPLRLDPLSGLTTSMASTSS